jgi:hypothetical protein
MKDIRDINLNIRKKKLEKKTIKALNLKKYLEKRESKCPLLSLTSQGSPPNPFCQGSRNWALIFLAASLICLNSMARIWKLKFQKPVFQLIFDQKHL